MYNNVSFHHNHVKGRTTATPRTGGLFGFNKKNDFSTIRITDNIIELTVIPRPLLRNIESYNALIKNNKLVNISDTGKYENPQTGEVKGLGEKLFFRAGVNGRYTIDGWNVRHIQYEKKKEKRCNIFQGHASLYSIALKNTFLSGTETSFQEPLMTNSIDY